MRGPWMRRPKSETSNDGGRSRFELRAAAVVRGVRELGQPGGGDGGGGVAAVGIVSFCILVLEHFHLLVVPVAIARAPFPDACIWVVPANARKDPNVFEIQNALNFCFSFPPHRFEVQPTGGQAFLTAVASANVASFLVAQGRCCLGDRHYLLFSTLDSAIAATKLSTGARRDVSTRSDDVRGNFEFQTRGQSIWAETGITTDGPTDGPRPASRAGLDLAGETFLSSFPPFLAVQVAKGHATIDGAISPDSAAASDYADSGDTNEFRVHSLLSAIPAPEVHSERSTDLSCRAPNGSQFDPFVTPDRKSGTCLNSEADPPRCALSASQLTEQPTPSLRS
ncbi:unnamed protein product [Urochloa humidicola]